MNLKELLANIPAEVKASSDASAATGTLITTQVATRGRVGDDWKMLERLDEQWSFRQPAAGESIDDKQQSDVLPCYRFGSSDIAAATGLVFVRFQESEKAEDHSEEFAQLGFTIQRTSPQQPHTAWLAPQSQNPADGIRLFPGLASVSGIAHAELQFLRPRVERSSGGVARPPGR